jgi:hypothetical protein
MAPAPRHKRAVVRAIPKNRLLAALPAADYRRLAPLLTTVSIHTKQLLHPGGKPHRYVYFPNGGVVSLTTALSDGTVMEAATVGDEGMVGIEAFLGPDTAAPGDTLAGAGYGCRTARRRGLPT